MPLHQCGDPSDLAVAALTRLGGKGCLPSASCPPDGQPPDALRTPSNRIAPDAAVHRYRPGQARPARNLGCGSGAAVAQPAPDGQEPARARERESDPAGGRDRRRSPTIESTADPTTWLIVTGWASTEGERKIADRR